MPTAYEQAWPRPRVIVTSFPHNPTTACVDLDVHAARSSSSRASTTSSSCTTSRTPTSASTATSRRRSCRPGAKDVAVELYTLTKSFSMAGWRMGFLVGNAEIVAALAQAQVVPRLRHVPADPDRGDRRDERGARLPAEVNEIYRGRRDALIDGLDRIGWHIEKPKGTMFVWAPIPEPYRRCGLEFADDARAGGEGRGRRPASASVRAARASSASRSSRTSSASARRPERSRACSASLRAPGRGGARSRYDRFLVPSRTSWRSPSSRARCRCRRSSRPSCPGRPSTGSSIPR